MKTQIAPISSWLPKSKKPIIIAGPCSAESEEQLMRTAIELKKQRTDIFRAGIWKPRTRPNSFEGVGTPGLKWMLNVKKETGMLIATEVANVKHVYEALKYTLDRSQNNCKSLCYSGNS